MGGCLYVSVDGTAGASMLRFAVSDLDAWLNMSAPY